MAGNPITASMSIELPVPAQTLPFGVAPPGESWGELYNTGFNTIDQHDHSPGKGLQIHPVGINIDDDLDFGDHNATNLRSVRFLPLSLGSLDVTDFDELIVSGVDLYYIDGTGTQIRLTASGSIVGTPGGIGGLVPPAAVTYASGPKTFTFEASPGFVAGLVAGPLVLTDPSASSGKAVTIGVPAGLAANYPITFPAALPASIKILTVSAAGAIDDVYDFDGTTIEVASNVIRVKAAGIGTSQIANSAVTSVKIANGAVGATQIATGGVGTTQLANDAVTTVKILDANITAPKILNGTITPSKIQANSIGPGRVALFVNWNAISAATGWTASGAFYGRDVLNLVHLFGTFTNSSGATILVTTLPAGFRPLVARKFGMSIGTFAPITVNTDGTVTIGSVPSPGQNMSIDGVSFSVDI